ncbi:glycosyltransferase [Mycobacterium deserti]|uniref:Glycosyltransferase n=1 Tax=Mycobacterium deserti TaxID=2978347 RepID=A0ABT2MHT7_9MYCO|nr:glycosyltransferase [Mycobacterium deserti]MCT7661104.1 glycosyltransferase [Mycobacterium deserti]
MPLREASVAIVIPYYEQQADLDRVLAALERQDYPNHLLEVIVADDGSSQPPVVDAAQLRCTVVRQANQGFRAAAARNLGAAASTAEVLCFLDADTVPEREYISNLVRLPSLVPDAVAVGRRRHADLDGWAPSQLSHWWSGGPAPRELPEPRWLVDGYAASADLLKLDHRSYRYVISSVMCCSRELFDDIGGFDESFVGYGGEDWEFAHRALAGGAVLHHARHAVAWHNGPDWALRPVAERTAGKNAEALALVRLITDPDARRHGFRYDVPDVAVEIDVGCHASGSLISTMSCFLDLDVGIWVSGAGADRLLTSLRLEDARIRTGRVPDRVRRRCRFVITVAGRVSLPRSDVGLILERCAEEGVGTVEAGAGDIGVRCRSSWALNRERRWATGGVRLREQAATDCLSTTLTLPNGALDLVEVDRDADLSW